VGGEVEGAVDDDSGFVFADVFLLASEVPAALGSFGDVHAHCPGSGSVLPVLAGLCVAEVDAAAKCCCLALCF